VAKSRTRILFFVAAGLFALAAIRDALFNHNGFVPFTRSANIALAVVFMILGAAKSTKA
jgi:hypothetical protein